MAGHEAEGHVLPGLAAFSIDSWGLGTPVVHDGEWLLEGVGHRGAELKGQGHLCVQAADRCRSGGRGERFDRGVILKCVWTKTRHTACFKVSISKGILLSTTQMWFLTQSSDSKQISMMILIIS